MSLSGRFLPPARLRAPARRDRGFTLVELMITVAIAALLVAIAVPGYAAFVERARMQKAMTEINELQMRLHAWRGANGDWPADLDAIDGPKVDPWGQRYQYLRMRDSRIADRRKDRSLNPINTDFDLYSMGPDGQTQVPLVSPRGQDDVIRAADGRFIGRATDF